MNLKQYERAVRSARTARTWFSRAALLLDWRDVTNPNVRAVFGYEAKELSTSALSDIAMMLPLFDAEQLEELEKQAKTIAALMRKGRIAILLKNTEGRTPEEAQAFLDKAADLSQDDKRA